MFIKSINVTVWALELVILQLTELKCDYCLKCLPLIKTVPVCGLCGRALATVDRRAASHYGF